MTLDDLIGKLENAALKYGKHTEVAILDDDTGWIIPIEEVSKHKIGIILSGDIHRPISED